VVGQIQKRIESCFALNVSTIGDVGTQMKHWDFMLAVWQILHSCWFLCPCQSTSEYQYKQIALRCCMDYRASERERERRERALVSRNSYAVDVLKLFVFTLSYCLCWCTTACVVMSIFLCLFILIWR
jgi:hypothetical protein